MKERPRGTGEPAKRPFFGWVTVPDAASLTDLYEITMLQTYRRRGMNEDATFDLFVRSLPPARRFLVVAGIEQALAYLESFRFSPAALDHLRSLGTFDSSFLDWLGERRFTGEVWALPEGEIAFAGESIIRVTAPLPEAQIVETFLLNAVLYQTGVASKAARLTIAADGRGIVDFSARRDHGTDASLKAARAAYIGGATATSNVLAGRLYGLPVSGTMAHSFVMAFDDERAAFEAFVREFPDRAILLVDTYEVERGVEHAAEIGRALRAKGRSLAGVRIDSGDLAATARIARRILDEAGLADARIFASGDLNEHKIAALVLAGGPIDAFGVGTELGVPADAPALGGVYKLSEYAGTGRAKRSTGKATLPGRKQIWRRPGFSDVIELAGAGPVDGEPLLRQVMQNGRASVQIPSLDEARERCLARLAELPADLRDLSPGPGREPELGPALRAASALP